MTAKPDRSYLMAVALKTESPVTISRAVDDRAISTLPREQRVREAVPTVPMTLVGRDGAADWTPCISGRHLRGKLRREATHALVDALMNGSGTYPLGADDYFALVHGGHGFRERQSVALGAEQRARKACPILGAFGASHPVLAASFHTMDCVAVDGLEALGQIPEGQRRNDYLHDPDMQKTLSAEDAERITHDDRLVQERASLTQEQTRLERERRRAKDDGASVEAIDERLQAIKDRLAEIKKSTISENTIDRPLGRTWTIAKGVRLEGEMRMIRAYPAEVGLVLRAIERWGALPMVGGHQALGCGRVSGEITIKRIEANGRRHPAGRIAFGDDDGVVFADFAADVEACLSAWDDLLNGLPNVQHAGENVVWTRSAIDALMA